MKEKNDLTDKMTRTFFFFSNRFFSHDDKEERKELKYTVEIHDNFDRFLISQGFTESKSDRDVGKLKETLLNHGEMFPMATLRESNIRASYRKV